MSNVELSTAPVTDNEFFTASLADRDPLIQASIDNELGRQQHEIELIASENIVSSAVTEAQGSVMTNKYAEGYPGKRYYGGCEHVDTAEALAIERACALYQCDYVNVQPHSGAQANQAVFLALIKPGDTFMGMDLAAGGHLTHGSPVNQSGKWFNAVTYGVDETTHLIDYDAMEAQALEHKPALIIAGGSAYPRTIDFARFRAVADKVGAYFMVDMAHFSGLVAAGEHPNPLEALQPTFKAYQQSVISNARTLAATLSAGGLNMISGGTDTHVMLVDLQPKGASGKAAEAALGRAGITCNKNSSSGS